MTNSTFEDLGVNEPLCRALEDIGYETPTPIQAESITSLLDGCDLLGVARTGTGKTAAFALPMLQHLHENPQDGNRRGVVRSLVLAPTERVLERPEA